MDITKYKEITKKIIQNQFIAVFICDLKNNRIVPVYYSDSKDTPSGMRELIGTNEADYNKSITQYANKYVHKENKQKYIAEANSKYVIKQLQTSDVYTQNYIRYNESGDLYLVENIFQKLEDEDIVLLSVRKAMVLKPSHDQKFVEEDTTHSKKTVLVIEDNPLNREILCDLLKEEYNILEASNGLEGLEVLKSNYSIISLVFLDLQMPVLDGFGYLVEAGNNPLFDRIPTIVVSASMDPRDELRCFELGAFEFVSKPYSSELVRYRAKNAIRLKESQAALSAIEIDSLTGAYTKTAFYHRATEWMHKNPGYNFTITVTDFSNFHQICDSYGENIGDLAMIALYKRLNATETPHIIGRYSNDQFMIIFHDDEDSDVGGIEAVAKEIEEQIGIERIFIKYGIYKNIDRNLPVSTCVNRALLSLKTIENHYEKPYAFFDEEFQKKYDFLHELELNMEHALANQEFKVYYQPKNDAKTGMVVGAEALVRWISPKFGFISPGEFIPLFEENGFITRLDQYVLRRICEDILDWKKRGFPIHPVSFNTSRRDFNNIQFLRDSLDMIHDLGMDPSCLHMEITESHYAIHPEDVINGASTVREHGIKIEMDDFGTGYSSLGMITKMAVDVIKLDMSFVRNMDTELPIIQTMIYLAHNIGCKVVAEGVETFKQLTVLKELGCDYVQGYYFSKPLPKDQFEEYIISKQNNS